MQVKRYEATDMREAMDTITQELGAEAVVLSSRKIRRKGVTGLFRQPVLEVMVAYDPEAGQEAGKPPPVTGARNAVAAYSRQSGPRPRGGVTALRDEDKDREVENLGERIDALDQMLSTAIDKMVYAKSATATRLGDEVGRLYCRLKESLVEEELAAAIAGQAEAAVEKAKEPDARKIMRDLVAERLGEPAPIKTKKFARKVVLFLGPTGVGKTTSLVKLAADFALGDGRKVGIINTDTYRIAAQEQLKTYADLLSVPVKIVYKLDEIGQALEELSDRDVILIDTTGKRPGDEQHRRDVEQLIELACPEDIMLCVSATTGFEALKEVVDTYDFIEGLRLIVTKLDETRYHGVLLNLKWYSGMPLAYVTDGQNVPDDISGVDTGAIAERLLGMT